MAKAKKKKTAKRKTKKKKTAKRKTKKKKTAKRKTKKKKTAKRKAKKKKASKRKTPGRKGKARKGPGQMLPGAKGGTPKAATLQQRAQHSKTLAEALGYIGALSDALDRSYGEIRGLRLGLSKMTEVTKAWQAEVDKLETAARKDKGKIKTLEAKLKKERERGKATAADVKTLRAELRQQSSELADMIAGVGKVKRRKAVRGKQEALQDIEKKGKRRKARRGKQRKMAAAFRQRDVAAGAACSLGVLRWGYSGEQDCQPGYGPSEAGRRLANLRHHGVAFNPALSPQECFDMGYEAGAADAGKRGKPKTRNNPGKRKTPRKPKQNPGSNARADAAARSVMASIGRL